MSRSSKTDGRLLKHEQAAVYLGILSDHFAHQHRARSRKTFRLSSGDREQMHEAARGAASPQATSRFPHSSPDNRTHTP